MLNWRLSRERRLGQASPSTREAPKEARLDVDVEMGRALLVEKGEPEQAIMYLQRAYARGARAPALPYLIGEALRHGGGYRTTLTGHAAALTSVAMDRDGSRAVTTSEDGTARVFEVEAGKLVAVLKGHEQGVTSAAFSPDGMQVITSGRDKTARLWEAATGKLAAVLKGHTQPVGAVAFAADGKRIVTSGVDGTVRFFDRQGKEAGGALAGLSGRTGALRLAILDRDGGQLAAFADQGAVIWNTRAAAADKPAVELWQDEQSVGTAAFSPDGSRLVVVGVDLGAMVYELKKDRENPIVAIHETKESPIRSAAIAMDNHTAVTGHEDGVVRLWHITDGGSSENVTWDLAELLTELRGHDGAVTAVALSGNGRRIISAGRDKTARVWERPERRPLHAINWSYEYNSQGLPVGWSPDGRCVAEGGNAETNSADQTTDSVDVRDVKSSKILRSLEGHKARISDVEYSPDGRRILSRDEDGAAFLWDSETGVRMVVLEGEVGRAPLWSPSGRMILAHAQDNGFAVWDSGTGKRLFVLGGKELPVGSAKFSPDGRRILTRHKDAAVRSWEAEGPNVGKLLSVSRLPGEKEGFGAAVMSGRMGVFTHADKMVEVWDVDRAERLRRFPGGGLSSVLDISPDGRRLFAVLRPGFAAMLETEGGEPLFVLDGITSAMFSPDGRLFATNDDAGVKVRDATTGRVLAKFELPARHTSIHSFGFSPDGRRLELQSSEEGELPEPTLTFWDVSPETRSAEELAALIRCRYSYRFESAGSYLLVPTAVDTAACSGR